jgi:hypothetical protein
LFRIRIQVFFCKNKINDRNFLSIGLKFKTSNPDLNAGLLDVRRSLRLSERALQSYSVTDPDPGSSAFFTLDPGSGSGVENNRIKFPRAS